MHKIVHIAVLIISYCLIIYTDNIHAQSDTTSSYSVINIKEVEIIGQKSPAVLNELPRMVVVVSSDETDCAPSHSLLDLLGYIANVDIRQRGKDGIQSDISIRGSSFDHNLILLNGINISDPQTGHFSLFLPVESESVKQIEVLNGPAARVHGANAFAGAINFITNPDHDNSFTLKTEAGQYGYFSNLANVNIASDKVVQELHFFNGSSSGYTKNTDYRRNSIFYQGIVTTKESTIDLQLGYADRSFGANSFYSPLYPDEFETNQLTFIALGYRSGDKIKIHPQLYWRRHRDRFELFREDDRWYTLLDSITISNNPDLTQYDTISWYKGHNHHISDIYGAQFTLNIKSRLGVTTLDWHLRAENLISTNIGYEKNMAIPVNGYEGVYYTKSDNRTNVDIHFEQTIDKEIFNVSGGLLVNWNSYLPDEINFYPGIDFRLFFCKPLSLYGSYNHTLGLPTFTDLSYKDTTNQGNSALKPYSQNSFEGGLRFMNSQAVLSAACFYNFGKDVIDWVWFADENKFKPININSYSSKGFELSGLYKVGGESFLRRMISIIRVNYTFVDMDKEIPGNITKYFNIRHKASAMIQHEFFKNFIISENLSYIQREGYYLTYSFDELAYQTHPFQPFWLMDLRISYTWKDFTFFSEVTNIFDKEYIDIGSVYQPGRWLTAGFKYNVKGF